MKDSFVNWLSFTCFIGLIPVILRLIAWIFSEYGIEPIAISDLIAFGLVLHASNINEVSSFNSDDKRWSSLHYATSIVFIAVYGLIYMTTVVKIPNLSDWKILGGALVLSLTSLFISFAIFYRTQRNLEYKSQVEAS